MRDAEQVEFPSTRLPRIEPRAPLVWIRVEGEWREGRITKWVHDPAGGRWLVWASYRGDPRSAYAWLLYDPETIRPRTGDLPPR
jgi:hypothetical protein